MKRDMELVRRILIEVEKADSPVQAIGLVDSDHNFDCIAYHIEMMREHGLVDAKVVSNGYGSYTNASVTALTWDGCDFLDTVRDDSVWRETMAGVAESVGTTTLDVVKQVASKVALRAVCSVIGF